MADYTTPPPNHMTGNSQIAGKVGCQGSQKQTDAANPPPAERHVRSNTSSDLGDPFPREKGTQHRSNRHCGQKSASFGPLLNINVGRVKQDHRPLGSSWPSGPSSDTAASGGTAARERARAWRASGGTAVGSAAAREKRATTAAKSVGWHGGAGVPVGGPLVGEGTVFDLSVGTLHFLSAKHTWKNFIWHPGSRTP